MSKSLALDGEVLSVGGHFGPNVGGETRHQFAAVDTSKGRLLPWSSAVGGSDHLGVWAMSTAGGVLRVGGGSRTVGGIA